MHITMYVTDKLYLAIDANGSLAPCTRTEADQFWETIEGFHRILMNTPLIWLDDGCRLYAEELREAEVLWDAIFPDPTIDEA